MNWLKPMLLMIVLGAILYGVYTVLNKGPATEPPIGAGREWAKPPDIQLGVIDDGKGGPSPMGNPDPRMGPGATGASPAGQAALPRLVYPANPATGDSAGSAAPATGSVYTPNSTAAANPANRGEIAASRPAPAAEIMPWSQPARVDSPNGSATPVVSGARDPAAGSVLGQRPDDASKATAPQESFAAAMDSAKGMLAEGKLVEALRKLTKWYNASQLNADESRQLIDLLGQLAGTVVYSRQHLLQPPYKVQPGDRLETIAGQYNVPWQLLAKINGIDDPNRLNPGDELKVVRGPFSAIVDLDKRQLTLMVDECYAGRFNVIAVGELARNIEGKTFDVGEKLPTGPMAGRDPSPIHHWVRLGGEAWIVGTSDPASIHPAGLNLNSRDAEDVYDILSTGSRVVVRR